MISINEKLIQEFGLKPFQVENAVKLIDEGNTIPFIARYRKEATRANVWWTASWYVW